MVPTRLTPGEGISNCTWKTSNFLDCLMLIIVCLKETVVIKVVKEMGSFWSGVEKKTSLSGRRLSDLIGRKPLRETNTPRSPVLILGLTISES